MPTELESRKLKTIKLSDDCRRCPICRHEIRQSFTITDPEGKIKTIWLFCSCGVVFRDGKVDRIKAFNEEWRKSYIKAKYYKDRIDLLVKTHFPLIESMIYGRRFLDAGYINTDFMDKVKERGWVTEGLDITDGFNTLNEYDRYDLIVMNHTLSTVDKPIETLQKAHNHLAPSGILWIIAPNTELMYKVGIKPWGWWDSNQNWIHFSETKLRQELERIGFEERFSHNNYDSKFMTTKDLYLLAQRSIVREEPKELKEIKNGENKDEICKC